MRLGGYSLSASVVVSALFLASCCCIDASGALCADRCRAAGACRLRTERAGDGPYRCYAGSDADCQASEVCAQERRCFVAEDGECVVADQVAERRCATSVTCRVWGGCHPRDGFCEPRSEDDCRASLQCRTQGRCSFDASRNNCFAGEHDCEGTTGCALEGLCTYVSFPVGRCALTAAGSCEQTLACRRDGRCAARPLEGCGEGCRVYYCGRPESASAPSPCTEGQGSALLVCAPDGRCIRSPTTGECEHVP